MPNYYDVLGIPRNADAREIRQAFRKLARQHHPDVNPGDPTAEEKFKLINEAHSVLSETDSRRKYDRYGDNWAQADQLDQAAAQARRRPPTGATTFSWSAPSREAPSSTTGGGATTSGGPTTSGGAGNIFEQLFRNIGQDVRNIGQDARRPASTEYPVSLTLEEAFQGAARVMELTGDRRIEVKIPPGVDNASKVHIPAGGGKDAGFNLVVSVRPHQTFQRKGRDLYREIDVSLEDAILGAEVTVPTLSGRVALTIPPETQNGQRFRMARQGMPGLNQTGVRGDLYTTVKVVLPTGLTTEEKDLIWRLRESRASRGG